MGRKHPRLANGMGSIKYLGKGRTNPYAVYAPEYNVTKKGSLSYTKAICYVPDWYTGFAVLVSYKAGTYKPGDEIDIARRMQETDEREMSYVAKKILSDYRQIGKKEEQRLEYSKHPFRDVADEYLDERFGEYSTQRFSKETERNYRSHLAAFETDRYTEDIDLDYLQKIVNDMSNIYSLSYITSRVAVLRNVFAYAKRKGYVDRNPVEDVRIPTKAAKSKHIQPYSDEELKKLWAASSHDKDARYVLIQCYSGFRLGAFYDHFEVHEDYFFGGVKKRADEKRRVVPIHSAIVSFIEDKDPILWPVYASANHHIGNMCERLNIAPHTSHSARHTFKRLCDKYGVNPTISRALMGHTLGTDIHDNVYTHFELDQLKAEIEKIKVENEWICAE